VNREASFTGSKPIRMPAGTLTFLSTMQRRRRAPAPTRTPGNTIESEIRAFASMYTPGPMTDRSTRPPETIEPWQRRLLDTRHPPVEASSEIFAGGSGGWWLYTGHSAL
jgi:hypothetical protein